MKNIYLFIAAIFCAIMTSCSSGNEPKLINPTSTEFTTGEIAKYVEIVDEPSELSFAVREGSIETQYIRLKVTLKMVKDGIKDVDPRDIELGGLLSVAIINIIDENDTKIQDLKVKDDDMLKLKKLLTGKKDDTAEITFEGEYHNDDDAPKWFKQAVKFTPAETGEIILESENTSDTENESESESIEVDTEEAESVEVGTEEAESIDMDNDYDAMLDKYEKFCNEYIKLIKKAKGRDINSLPEYQRFMEKVAQFELQFGDCITNLSPEQLNRFNRIHAKVMKANKLLE